jgi:hypothetical protein
MSGRKCGVSRRCSGRRPLYEHGYAHWRSEGVDFFALGASGTSFVRVRVKLDVNKPLTMVVGLHPEGYGQMVFQVLYKKFPNYVMSVG